MLHVSHKQFFMQFTRLNILECVFVQGHSGKKLWFIACGEFFTVSPDTFFTAAGMPDSCCYCHSPAPDLWLEE